MNTKNVPQATIIECRREYLSASKPAERAPNRAPSSRTAARNWASQNQTWFDKKNYLLKIPFCNGVMGQRRMKSSITSTFAIYSLKQMVSILIRSNAMRHVSPPTTPWSYPNSSPPMLAKNAHASAYPLYQSPASPGGPYAYV